MKVSAYLNHLDNERMFAKHRSSANIHWVDMEFEGDILTVFVDTREIAERLAAGINAAWQEPQDGAGDACGCPTHSIAAE